MIGRHDFAGLVAIVVAIGTVVPAVVVLVNWTQFSCGSLG